MSKPYLITNYQLPPPNKWCMTFTKDEHIKVCLPTAPNPFHRLMQKLILGINYRRLDDEQSR